MNFDAPFSTGYYSSTLAFFQLLNKNKVFKYEPKIKYIFFLTPAKLNSSPKFFTILINWIMVQIKWYKHLNSDLN